MAAKQELDCFVYAPCNDQNVDGRDKPGHDAERWFWAENRQVIEVLLALGRKLSVSFALSSRHGRLVPAIHVLQNISMRQGYVYFLTNRPNGTLYVGVTSNLAKRVYEHRTEAVDGFTK